MPGESKKLLGAIVLTVGVLAVGGCGTRTVEGNDVERVVADGLTERTGQRPTAIECPPQIEAKAGEKARCTVKGSDGSEIGLTVTMTDAEGKFDYTVDERVSKPPTKR